MLSHILKYLFFNSVKFNFFFGYFFYFIHCIYYNVMKIIVFFYYSVFYVFYEQYLTIWRETLISLGYSLSVIFAVTLILTLSLFSAITVLLTVCMIIINIGGLMYWWHIELNAVSLVNLVVVWQHKNIYIALIC